MERSDASPLWTPEQAGAYENANYGAGLTGYVMRASHALVEKEFGPDAYFERVLEVGAGSGVHIGYVRHRFGEYIMSDGSEAMIQLIPPHRLQGNGRILTRVEDATKLSLPDGSVDRVIATHVLEHLYRPHEIMNEWLRVLKPGGVLSLVLPCDPGLAWRLGRNFGPRKSAQKRGLDYDYVMALEHVNPIGNLVAIVEHLAKRRSEYWWPFRVASADINLIYGVNITKVG